MPRITEHPNRPTRHHDQQRSDRGSATMLVPVGVLILMFLAAIAVDLSAVHMAQRNLQDVLSSAADDAASSLDRDQIRLGDQVVIEQSDAARIATAEVMTEVADAAESLAERSGRPNRCRGRVRRNGHRGSSSLAGPAHLFDLAACGPDYGRGRRGPSEDRCTALGPETSLHLAQRAAVVVGRAVVVVALAVVVTALAVVDVGLAVVVASTAVVKGTWGFP